MKDKRTYFKLKEHGEDMTHENERKHSNEDRGSGDLTYLIETHQKEIYDYKEAMGKMQMELTVLRGSKKIIEDLARTIQELRDDNKKLSRQIEDLIDRNKKESK